MIKILNRISNKIKHYNSILDEIYRSTIRWLDGELGKKLRHRYYKKRLYHMGKGVIIDTGVFIEGAEFISIGDNTHIDKNCILVGSPSNLDLSHRYLKVRNNPTYKGQRGNIIIGKECHISQNTMLYGYGGISIGDYSTLSVGAKVYSLTSMAYNPYNRGEIVSIVPYDGKSPTLEGAVVLGNNVWAGIDCIISPGITIGDNSFVKSLSIVNSSFEENSYVGGNPAQYIRRRYEIN